MPDATGLTAVLRASVGAQLRLAYTRLTAAAVDDGPQASEFVVMDTLADQDVDSQRELAERLGINRTIMVRLVDRLKEAGYVTRTRNPANRRSYVLSLTPAGRKALTGMRREVAKRDARLTAALTSHERTRLNALLTTLLPYPDQSAIASTTYLVAQAHFRMRRLGDALLADTGLRTRHFGSLAAIERLASCSQQRFAVELGITEPMAAQVVDELVQAGLVERGEDPGDRRRYALELTPLGRERIADVTAAAERLRAESRSLLGGDGEAELHALLTKLLAAKG